MEEKKVNFLKKVKRGDIKFDHEGSDILISQCKNDDLITEGEEAYTLTDKGSSYLDRKESKQIQKKSYSVQKIQLAVAASSLISAVIGFIAGRLI